MIVVKCVSLAILLHSNWLGINQVKLVICVLISNLSQCEQGSKYFWVGYNLVWVISNDFW
jgi:hypothetical protein